MKSQPWLASSSRRISRRKFLAGATAGAGAAALIACGGGDSSDEVLTIDPNSVRQPGAVIFARDNWKLADESDKAVPGGVYPGRVNIDLTSSWDPYLANTSTVEDFNDESYEYLVRPNRGPGIEPGSAEYTKVLGRLAESWEVGSDSLTYTFTLRRGVKFQPIAPVNGREMTIDDWKTSVEKFLAISTNRDGIVEVLDKVEYPDSRHMVIKMKEPYAPFMTRMAEKDFAFKIVPKELNDKQDLLATTQIGTNAKIVDKVEPSVTRQFRRFDSYWGGKPFIERWHYPIIVENAQAYAQFLTQNIISFAPNARDALTTRKDAPQAIMIHGEDNPLATPYIVIGKVDLATSPWRDARVRVALRRAIDFDAIWEFQSNRQAFQAAGIEIDKFFNTNAPRDPSFWLDPRKGELGDGSKNYFFDVAEAKKMVDAAGYPSGFDMDIWTNIGSNEETNNLMIDYWTKSGFVRPKNLPKQRQEYFDNVTYAATFKGISGTSSGAGGATDVDYILFRNFYSKGPVSAVVDPKTDEFVVAQRRALDPQKRAAILKDWQLYAANMMNCIPTRHLFATWTFEWPWLHNSNQLPHRQWLDADMPRRSG